MYVKKRYPGEERTLQPTPPERYFNRRDFLQKIGVGIGASLPLPAFAERDLQAGSGSSIKPIRGATDELEAAPPSARYPAARNNKYELDRPLTEERIAARYNNFYEFTPQKDAVLRLVERFTIDPWRIEIDGLVENPIALDIQDFLTQFPLEERLYRLRCVETWAMAVPWTGVPLATVLKQVQPKSQATHVRFISFLRPDEAPGQKSTPFYPWPYQEGLRLDEAMNELTLLATGIYGHPLPKQHGAPIRLVVPWKYGFKSAKSIQKIELVDYQPATFWNTLIPNEYDFYANVNPKVPHPRWSQAMEWLIDTQERLPTKLYNGYEEYVRGLYPT